MMKSKYFKILALVLALVLTVSAVTWGAMRANARQMSVTNARVAAFSSSGGSGYDAGTLTSGSFSLWFNTTGNTDEKYTAANEKWTCTDGQWAYDHNGKDAQKLLWAGAGNTATWWAVYPYAPNAADDDSTSAFYIPVEQSTEDALLAADYLWANGTADSSALTINFQHMMSKFVINLTQGTEVESGASVASVVIGNVPTCVETNLSSLTVSSASEVGDITALAVTPAAGSVASYEAIVAPADYDPTVVVTMTNGRTFTVQLSAPDGGFVSGTQYNISLQVGQDVVNISGITVEPWTEISDAGNLETE